MLRLQVLLNSCKSSVPWYLTLANDERRAWNCTHFANPAQRVRPSQNSVLLKQEMRPALLLVELVFSTAPLFAVCPIRSSSLLLPSTWLAWRVYRSLQFSCPWLVWQRFRKERKKGRSNTGRKKKGQGERALEAT